MKTIGDVVAGIKQSGKQEDLVSFFCALNSELKWNHENHMCVTKIDVNSKINKQSFVDTVIIGNDQDIKDDIEEFALTAINSFIYFNSLDNSYIPLNKETIIENSSFVSQMIPSVIPDDNYYIDIITGKTFTYYEEYINALQNQSDYLNSNNMIKSYSTPIGKAFSDKNLDAAFINVMFYPVIIASISILLAVIYVTASLLIE